MNALKFALIMALMVGLVVGCGPADKEGENGGDTPGEDAANDGNGTETPEPEKTEMVVATDPGGEGVHVDEDTGAEIKIEIPKPDATTLVAPKAWEGAMPSGSLNGVGSDTLLQLVTAWLENCKQFNPNLQITYTGKGSSTGPPALTQGTSLFAPMSRPMKPGELETFTTNRGYEPLQLKVAIDAVTVYVNKDNPIEALSYEQLAGIFGAEGEQFSTWGEVFRSAGQDVPEAMADQRISLFGRNSASGTYSFFKKNALGGGDYREDVKEMPGSPAVVDGVGADLGGIGYSGAGYGTAATRSDVKVGETIESAVPPVVEHALDGSYSLARPLLIYVDKKPNTGVDNKAKWFMYYGLSTAGQKVATKLGFFALPEEVRTAELAKLN
jgi:phosphate transport system substrate-binding protein